MKLFELKKGDRIMMDGEVVVFDHVDGMYSYCKLEGGDNVVHLSVMTPVKKINDVYEIDE